MNCIRDVAAIACVRGDMHHVVPMNVRNRLQKRPTLVVVVPPIMSEQEMSIRWYEKHNCSAMATAMAKLS